MKYFVYEKDKRGSFTKNFLKSKFNNFLIKEVYFAKSKNIILGPSKNYSPQLS